MQDKIDSLNNKIKQLEEELVKQNDYYIKLTKEIEVVKNNIGQFSGAIQAYRASLQLFDPNANSIPEVIENT